MKITKITGIGIEIKKCIQRNSVKAAQDWNITRARKYLRECVLSKDLILIDYAHKLLNLELSK